MCCIADLHASEATADARDAAEIAEAARSMPRTLHSLRLTDEPLAELVMLCAFRRPWRRADHADQQPYSRPTYPDPSHIGMGSRADPEHPAVLDRLERYPSHTELAVASEKTLANLVTTFAPRMGKSLAAKIVQVQSEQAVVIPATTIAMPRLAQQLASLRRQRGKIAGARYAWYRHTLFGQL